jgi:hypothetical protein
MLKDLVAHNADAAGLAALLHKHAAYVRTQPVVARPADPGTTGLNFAREALDYIMTTSLAYLLGGSAADLDRAVAEALNLAVTWSDWNFVQHALDTAETSLAVSLAYDWLFADLNATVRSALLDGLVTKGLAVYNKYIGTNHTPWMGNTINWNCVCSAGGMVAVLAVAGDAGAPTYAWDGVFDPLLAGVPPCVAAYRADNSWMEGFTYWSYASKYNVWNMAAMRSVLGTDFGLTSLVGVSRAPLFPMYMTGANALTDPGHAASFNWADAHIFTPRDPKWPNFDAFPGPFMQWWGSGDPFNFTVAAYWARATWLNVYAENFLGAPAWGNFAEALVFFNTQGTAAEVAALPTSVNFDVDHVSVFRSSWTAPTDRQGYLGLKGGNSSWTHNHLDLGSFVLDVQGARIAEDMGVDNYSLPGYFGPERLTYYRLNSRGHNVVMFGNTSQVVGAAAPITAFGNSVYTVAGALVDGYAVVDLHAAYSTPAPVAAYQRGFVSLGNVSAALVVDEFEFTRAEEALNLTWQLHTLTKVSLGPGPTRAALGPGSVMTVVPSATVCPGIHFAAYDLEPVLWPPQYSGAGYTRIDGIVPTATACSRIAVFLGDPALAGAFTGGGGGGGSASAAAATLCIRPIDQWVSMGPVGPC